MSDDTNDMNDMCRAQRMALLREEQAKAVTQQQDEERRKEAQAKDAQQREVPQRSEIGRDAAGVQEGRDKRVDAKESRDEQLEKQLEPLRPKTVGQRDFARIPEAPAGFPPPITPQPRVYEVLPSRPLPYGHTAESFALLQEMKANVAREEREKIAQQEREKAAQQRVDASRAANEKLAAAGVAGDRKAHEKMMADELQARRLRETAEQQRQQGTKQVADSQERERLAMLERMRANVRQQERQQQTREGFQRAGQQMTGRGRSR